MRLLLIRHGKAEDREPSKDDAQRALTTDGRRKMKLAAQGLRTACKKIDLLATSPKKRAVQTAQILYAAYHDEPQFVELDLLVTASPTKIIAWLKRHHLESATVALVGHEPGLSRLVGALTTGQEKSIVTLKKAAACVIEFPKAIALGKGVLNQLFQPGDLRRFR